MVWASSTAIVLSESMLHRNGKDRRATISIMEFYPNVSIILQLESTAIIIQFQFKDSKTPKS